MSWPLSQDYNEAIQDPFHNFSDAELRTGEAAANALGIPMPRSGNFADVYELRSRSGGHWAVKCFTREVPGLRERYAAISRHLKDANLPFIVDFTFLEQGIRVGGGWYPVLKMQWVEGLTLNEFVRQYADKPAMLQNLLQIWVRMAVRLREAGIAHADLQHGNVLLVPGSTGNSLAVKLVDYDGMFVPALAGGNSGEVGHPCYQHPQRLTERTYSLEVDRFPLLMVATALDGLRVGGRALWERYDSGDNLLFREADLQAPVKSRLFYELLKLGDQRASRLASQTLDALKGRLEVVPLLEELLPELHTPPAPKPAAAPKRTTVVKASAAQPVTEAAATNAAWDFGSGETHHSHRRRRGGLMRWVRYAAVVGLAGLVLAGGIVALGLWNESQKQKDEVRTAQNNLKAPSQSSGTSPQLPDSKEEQPDGHGQRREDVVPQAPASPTVPKPQETSEPPSEKRADDFVSLFNGTELSFRSNWKTHRDDKARWEVKDGVLIGSGGPGHLFSERGDYRDFHLRLEVRINEGGNSGVYFRTQFGPGFPKGYEAQINSTHGDPIKTGSLYPTFNPELSNEQRDQIIVTDMLVKPNEWFTQEVIAQGNHIVIKVNGKTTVDFVDTASCYTAGHFALQQHNPETVVEVRKIKIKELSARFTSPEPPKPEAIAGSQNSPKPEKPSGTLTATDVPGEKSEAKPEIAKNEGNNASPEPAKPTVTDGFVALFNGRDLTGWKPHPDDKARWEIKDGVLIGSGERGHLFSERGDYENFHFRVEAAINDGGNSGQYFRTQFGPKFPKGYEAQINSTASDSLRTGSLIDLGAIVKVSEQLHKPDEWFTQEVIVEGDHIVIKVNGKPVVDKHDKRYKKGHLALQVQDAATVVKFRRIEVKELTAIVAESAPSRSQGKEGVAYDDKGNIIKGSQPPLDRKAAAVKAYNKSCADARASLLKAFNLALDQLAKRKGSTEERVKLIEAVKEEKERFESRGLIPWSEPMRTYVERYLVLLVAAQAKLTRVYESLIDAQLRAKNDSKVADLRAELKNRLDIRVLGKWQRFFNGRNGGIVTLYSNGKIDNSEGNNTWTYDKGTLIYRWPNPQAPKGAWIDTHSVSSDGRTYTGTNNNPRPELRPKFSGVYAKDD